MIDAYKRYGGIRYRKHSLWFPMSLVVVYLLALLHCTGTHAEKNRSHVHVELKSLRIPHVAAQCRDAAQSAEEYDRDQRGHRATFDVDGSTIQSHPHNEAYKLARHLHAISLYLQRPIRTINAEGRTQLTETELRTLLAEPEVYDLGQGIRRELIVPGRIYRLVGMPRAADLLQANIEVDSLAPHPDIFPAMMIGILESGSVDHISGSQLLGVFNRSVSLDDPFGDLDALIDFEPTDAGALRTIELRRTLLQRMMVANQLAVAALELNGGAVEIGDLKVSPDNIARISTVLILLTNAAYPRVLMDNMNRDHVTAGELWDQVVDPAIGAMPSMFNADEVAELEPRTESARAQKVLFPGTHGRENSYNEMIKALETVMMLAPAADPTFASLVFGSATHGFGSGASKAYASFVRTIRLAEIKLHGLVVSEDKSDGDAPLIHLPGLLQLQAMKAELEELTNDPGSNIEKLDQLANELQREIDTVVAYFSQDNPTDETDDVKDDADDEEVDTEIREKGDLQPMSSSAEEAAYLAAVKYFLLPADKHPLVDPENQQPDYTPPTVKDAVRVSKRRKRSSGGGGGRGRGTRSGSHLREQGIRSRGKIEEPTVAIHSFVMQSALEAMGKKHSIERG